MSRVDEQIKEDLARLTRPVRTEGLLERVASRKARRRSTRRIESAALAAVVLVGTVLTTVGLIRVFERGDREAPGGRPNVATPLPSSGGAHGRGAFGSVETAICDETSL